MMHLTVYNARYYMNLIAGFLSGICVPKPVKCGPIKLKTEAHEDSRNLETLVKFFTELQGTL